MPSENDPEPIEATLVGLLRQLGIQPSPAQERVYAALREAAGPKLALHLHPVRWKRGELMVEVGSAAHLHELSQFTGEALRQRVNQELGADLIQRIVFKPHAG